MTQPTMLDTRPIEAIEEEVVVSPSTRRPLLRYLLALLLVPLALYLLPFAVMRLPGFERWGGSFWGPVLNYSFTTAGQNADVVIFGDSSAIHGILPTQMAATLGLKTLILPNTGGSLPVIGDLPLRSYLRANRPPKLIVLYFSPWDLDYAHNTSKFIFEGEEMLLQHGSMRELVAYAVHHPVETLAFPFQAYATCPKSNIMAALHHEHRGQIVAAGLGHVDSSATSAGGRMVRPNLKGPCQIPAKLLDQGKTGTVEHLISQYTSAQTKTLVFLAPIPDCENKQEVLRRSYSNLAAQSPKVMPPSLYREDDFFIHLDPKAVPAATASLTDAVRGVLNIQTADVRSRR